MLLDGHVAAGGILLLRGEVNHPEVALNSYIGQLFLIAIAIYLSLCYMTSLALEHS